MILLVDVGNTRIKWRCLDFMHNTCAQDVMLTKEISYDSLVSALQSYEFKKIFLSSVGGASVVEVFKSLAEKHELELCVVESKKEMCGLRFAYKNAERLGVDRCLAMIGAYNNGSGVLVVDAGSAITADYVNDSGVHLGGYILPGYESSKGLLLGKTANVGVVAGFGVLSPGKDTESCVKNGFLMLYKSLLDGFGSFARQVGINRLVITGGDALLLVSLGSKDVELYENLVLDGLQKYALYY